MATKKNWKKDPDMKNKGGGKGVIAPNVKTARKAKTRKHTNDAHYGSPKGGHEIQNLPKANLPMDNEGTTSRIA